MRTWTGWAAAAIVAAGCGGSMWGGDAASAGGGRRGEPVDERAGSDAVCAACKVTGGGQLKVAGRRVQVAFQATPGPGTEPGAAGVPATGRIQLHELGGELVDLGVDTILSCRREDGRLIATLGGPLGEADRFELDVEDGGEPPDDWVSWSGLSGGGPVPFATGNLQVHDLERCEPTAGDGGTEGEGGTGTGGEGGDATGGDGGTGDGGTGGTPPDPFIPL